MKKLLLLIAVVGLAGCRQKEKIEFHQADQPYLLVYATTSIKAAAVFDDFILTWEGGGRRVFHSEDTAHLWKPYADLIIANKHPTVTRAPRKESK